jgi:hypothetical protein
MKSTARAPLTALLTVLALLLAGCLLEDKKDDGDVTDPTAWAGNVQDWMFLDSVGSGVIIRDSGRCHEEWNTGIIRYHLNGDSLHLGWSYPLYPEDWDGESPVDTFWFGGVYARMASGNSVEGAWKLTENRPWEQQHLTLPQHVQDDIETWDFLYEGEEIFISQKILLLAYPRLWLSQLRRTEMEGDDEVAFQYVGKDSLRITRDGETAGLKYKAFSHFRARSSLASRPAVNVDLSDSCNYANAALDSTWIGEVVWGEDFWGDELEKKSAAADAKVMARGGRHSR